MKLRGNHDPSGGETALPPVAQTVIGGRNCFLLFFCGRPVFFFRLALSLDVARSDVMVQTPGYAIPPAYPHPHVGWWPGCFLWLFLVGGGVQYECLPPRERIQIESVLLHFISPRWTHQG